jgi:hypothetical protein
MAGDSGGGGASSHTTAHMTTRMEVVRPCFGPAALERSSRS